MSEKTLKNAIYFLVAVTVLYLLTSFAGGGSGATGGDTALAAALEGMDVDGAVRIDIVGPRDTVHLERTGQDWTANGFRADTTAVSRLLRALDEVVVSSVAATNPANHGRLGVDPDSAWTLRVDDDEVLLGKTGSQFRTAYARLPGADAVSLVRGDLRAAAARSLVDWRDKVVVRVDTALVTAVRIERDGTTALYERQDSSWAVGGGEADATTIRNVLQELASLRATGFAPEDGEVPATPDRIVQALDGSAAEIASLSLFDREGNVWITSSQSPYVFEIPSFRADRVAPATPEQDPD